MFKSQLFWIWLVALISALGPITMAILATIQHKASERDQALSTADAVARQKETTNALASTGEILSPTAPADSPELQLLLGSSIFKCPRSYDGDLAQLLAKIVPFPLFEQQYLKVENDHGHLWVGATLKDKDSNTIGVIERNRFRFNKNLTIDDRNPNRVTVRDAAQTVLLDVALVSPTSARIEGILYGKGGACTIDKTGLAHRYDTGATIKFDRCAIYGDAASQPGGG